MRERGIEDQWVIDSAALGNWHEGNPANSRARQTLKNHNIKYTGRARQVSLFWNHYLLNIEYRCNAPHFNWVIKLITCDNRVGQVRTSF